MTTKAKKVRKAPVKRRASQTYSGCFPSEKMDCGISYWSILENEALLLLETDPSIDEFGLNTDLPWLRTDRELSFLPYWYQRGEAKTLLWVGPETMRVKFEKWIEEVRLLASEWNYELDIWTDVDIRAGDRVANARRIYFEQAKASDFDPDLFESKLKIAFEIGQAPLSIEALLTALDLDPGRLDLAFCIMQSCGFGLADPHVSLSAGSVIRIVGGLA